MQKKFETRLVSHSGFDLNVAIENWRNELAALPQLTSDDRRELEKHLTDSMAELRGHGLNDEEAFWLARRRIGQPQQLAEEFEKANPAQTWRERLVWILLSLIVLQVWAHLVFCLVMVLNTFLNQIYNSLPPQNLQNILNVNLEFFFYYIPVIGIIALIATGRLLRVMDYFSLNSCSKAKIAGIGMILVLTSSSLNALTNWWANYMDNHLLPFSFLFGKEIVRNMIHSLWNMIDSLIWVALLLWVMVQDKKTSKIRSSLKK